MTNTMYHRGPDDEGHYIRQNVGIGMRRLSIIDLMTGHQPIHNEDKSIWTVCNGEIYNYKELRVRAEALGHKFYTKSDIEVIIHLYEEYGENFLDKLIGMFSLAIWDERQNKLILARDRIGIKPLFYYIDDHKLIFGSEIKSILLGSNVVRDIDVYALSQYLTHNFVPAPLTMFRGIKKLLPGCILIYQNAKATIKQYWNITYIESDKHSEAYFSNRLYEILRSSVQRHLVSDVPLGAFLSGGIDSSVLVGMMSALVDKPVKTFTIGFEEEGYDESKFARMVAKRFRTDHYELIVKPDTVNILPKLIWHLDEPLGDSCALPMYYLSKFAREYVKVVLSGDGGDELFAGYDRYRREKFSAVYGTVPPFIRKSLIWGLISRFPDGNHRIRALKSRTEFFNKNVDLPLEKRYLQSTEIMSADIKYQLLTQEVKHNFDTSNTTDSISLYFSDSAASNSLNKMLYVDMKTYLPDDLLTKVDKMTMAHSLEARVPFLDHNLVEFAATIPVHLKLKGFIKTKYLLRKYLKQYFPSEIYNRRKKGFNLPVGEWLRKGLRDFTQQTLLDSKAC